MNPETTLEYIDSLGLVMTGWQKKALINAMERESLGPLRTQAELRRKPSVPKFRFVSF